MAVLWPKSVVVFSFSSASSSIWKTPLRYLSSVVIVATASAGTYLLDLHAPEPSLYLFFGAIAISAWYLGSGPSWLSVLLSILTVDYLFVPPIYVFNLSAKDTPWLAAFIACAFITNAVSLTRRRLERSLIEARRDLEQRVLDRTQDLTQANTMLLAETAERSRAEAALRETQAELARTARIMMAAEFSASIAHEINQPLAAIVANSDAALNWLERSPPAIPEALNSIAAVISAGERSAAVIKQIRALTTKEAPAKTSLDINDVVAEIGALVQSTRGKRDISFKTRLESNLPSVIGDRIQLQQLLLNLVSNGFDALNGIAGRQREVVIRTRRLGHDRLAVSVEDSGRGFVDVDMSRLFHAFYTTKPQGMGMGLSICRSIIEDHGGKIRVKSKSPHGALFEIELPAGVQA